MLVETNILALIQYRPYGEKMAEYVSGGTTGQRYVFTEKERDTETGYDYFGARYYDSDLGRWLSVDPLMDKYPGWSPYNYVMNNPLVLVDPDGREIRIYTGEKDENGDDIYLTYVAGMEYSGNNQFVLSVVNALNAMNSVEIGAIALRSLIASFNSFNIKNIFSKEKGTAGYIRNINGGGDILAGEFMNQTINTNVQSIAHELFHGLQHENGGIYGVNSEVEAYLFGRAVQASYTQIAVLFNGNGTKIGNVFRDAMNELLFSETFNEKTFNRAVEAFQKGNPYNGLYKKAKVHNNFRPIINQFYPLWR